MVQVEFGLLFVDDFQQQVPEKIVVEDVPIFDIHHLAVQRKLGPLADNTPRIKTLRGKGYLLVRRPGAS